MERTKAKVIEGESVRVNKKEYYEVYRKMNLKRCEEIVIYNLENCGIEMKPDEVKKLIEIFEDMYYNDCNKWERMQDAGDLLGLNLEMNFENIIKYDNNYRYIKE